MFLCIFYISAIKVKSSSSIADSEEGNTDYHELGEFRDESNYDKLL